jgi:ubiquinone/menaquinone biosynthesis C-methylase UbiE
MNSDREAINRWNRSAPFWEKHREVIGQMLAPITSALVEDAHVGVNQTVLDVGTGPGEPALSLARLVGPAGKICGIDPSAEMVASARSEAARLGLENVQLDIATADRLPFADDTFDAVVSRLGAMFFPSPADAIREILRVLKPGRKLALAVWHFADRNPFHSVLSRVMDRHVDPTPLEPDALDAFRFATPGKLLKFLAEAGVVAPSERLLKFKIEASLPVEDFWTLRREMSDQMRNKLAALPPEQLANVNRDMLEALGEYATDAGMSFPAEVLTVSGRKQLSAERDLPTRS